MMCLSSLTCGAVFPNGGRRPHVLVRATGLLEGEVEVQDVLPAVEAVVLELGTLLHLALVVVVGRALVHEAVQGGVLGRHRRVRAVRPLARLQVVELQGHKYSVDQSNAKKNLNYGNPEI